ncbi:MAG: chemotaxis protein CheW [Gemmatimonadota bacterium]
MKKKRIRYSELAVTPSEAVVTPSEVEGSAPHAVPEVVVTPGEAVVTPSEVEGSAPPVVVPPAVPVVAFAKKVREAPPPRVAPPAPIKRTADLLMFRVGSERFALALSDVEEVIDLPVIHHVPEMPPAMLGVVSVRGALTPVYSPHGALGLPLALRDAVLIFREGRALVGVLIDDVEDAISIDMRDVRRSPGVEVHEGLVLGVAQVGDALVTVLSGAALVSACQTAVLLEIA